MAKNGRLWLWIAVDGERNKRQKGLRGEERGVKEGRAEGRQRQRGRNGRRGKACEQEEYYGRV
jgi:hypothetical protein